MKRHSFVERHHLTNIGCWLLLQCHESSLTENERSHRNKHFGHRCDVKSRVKCGENSELMACEPIRFLETYFAVLRDQDRPVKMMLTVHLLNGARKLVSADHRLSSQTHERREGADKGLSSSS